MGVVRAPKPYLYKDYIIFFKGFENGTKGFDYATKIRNVAMSPC